MPAYHQSSTVTKHDDYWKLDTYGNRSAKEMVKLLEAKGYYAPKVRDKAMLQDSLQRADRGLLSYTKLSNLELKSLYSQRKGPDWNTKCGQRDWLLGHLIALDDNPEFHKFTSLPPELRLKVYENYFASFRSPVTVPSQPPLTRASRLLRNESLVLFYKSCEFHFGLEVMWHPWLPWSSRRCRVSIPDKVLLFASVVGKANLSAIRKIHLDVYGVSERSRNGSKETFMVLKLDINGLRQRASFREATLIPLKIDGTKIRFDKVDAQVVLHCIQRVVGKGLSLGLLYELRSCLEQVMSAQGLARVL